MQRTLVEDERWISQRRFLHALNYCMLLPGPEAQQLAIYIGWLLKGTRRVGRRNPVRPAFLGAPYVERLRSNHALSAALTGITAGPEARP
jgi:hypothetical protein